MKTKDLVYILELLNNDVVGETSLKKEIQEIIKISESGRYGQFMYVPIMPTIRVENLRGGR
jgi:hypothetical protein